MGTRETIVLGKDYGQAKKGDVFVRGDLSHGVPEYYKTRGKNDPKEWYWKKGTDKSECKFLHFNNFTFKHMFTDQWPSDKTIHICKECSFEIERNGHSLECSQRVEKRWQDFNSSEQKKILEESAKQGAEDQDKLCK